MNITDRPLYLKSERKPLHSEARRAFIRTLPCVICLRTRNIECAHTPGERGMGQKADDSLGIPLCSTHHKEQHRIGWKRFIVDYRLNLPVLLERLNARLHIVVHRQPASARYVAGYQDTGFILGFVEDGFKRSMQLATDCARAWLTEEITRLHQKRNAA
jgi:hypothetical protein